MNKPEAIAFAIGQTAKKWSCEPDAFRNRENMFLCTTDVFFEMITFGQNAVIRADARMCAWCREYLGKLPADRMMDGDGLYQIENKLRTFGKKLSGQHVAYLQLEKSMPYEPPSGFRYALYAGEAVKALYVHRTFCNALNYAQDLLACVAYDGDQIASIAGADDYNPSMWQIGIDTVETYRRRGLARHLVSCLAAEITDHGAVPYYTTWGANIASTYVALQSGFRPVWVRYYAEEIGEAHDVV